ncbi:DNA-binding transcriptional regulator, LysR family [Nakamurella panacisegetis]|uniref:DNA-binding transcriptional regulator, LysR family n=1 Tax=Nakamurella panacisegetis TaxID=1090615 RepID=A0A1H0I1V6_9ACTN|nr:LysR family transcriptional regulator [Nakamurella panacisegetis]SDO25442.1 DNA-binding transcriptional regulator, LysR family [Nakamurella panacisegetis]
MTYESFGLATTLEQLTAIAEFGQITAAAQHLGIPQPTLSRAMARLSRDLGTPLLQKDGRGVRLTRHGELLAASAGRALDELMAGVRAVRAEADPSTGTVILGFLHSLGPLVVPALLRGFRREYPGVTVRLVQDSADGLLRRIPGGGVDLVLAAPVPGDPRWRSRPLAEQPLALLVPDGDELAQATTVGVSDLAGRELITLAAGYGVRTITDQLLQAAGIPRSYAFESQEMTTAAGLVAAGLGIAILPPGNEVPGTRARPLSDPAASRTLSLAWSADRELSPPGRHLRSHLIRFAPNLLTG